MRNFLPFLSGGGAPAAPSVPAALAAITEKANAALARGDQLALELGTATASLTALTTERDGLQAALTEAQTKLGAAETALAETAGKLTALEAEMPEKVKAAAIEIAAGAGIPAGGAPPIQPGSAATDFMAAVATATNAHEYGRAILGALGIKVGR